MLVTGGAGFVGSHLCEFLVKRGDHVCLVRSGRCVLLCVWGEVGDACAQREHAKEMFVCFERALKCTQRHTLQKNPQVICIDNFFTGSKENVAHLLDKTNFELIRHDVVEPILLEVDQVYHLACPASPVHYK